ncbi:MAG: winged helix-turn-helix domain-containing protein [Dehalococcoidia bacterium]
MPAEAAILGSSEPTVGVLQEALGSLGLRSHVIRDSALEAPRAAEVLVFDLSQGADRLLDELHSYRVGRPDAIIIAIGGEGTPVATAALDEGADAVVPSGSRATHVAAQVRALLRRTSRRPEAQKIKIGMLDLDITAREATVRGKALRLTAGEFKVLAFLAENVGRVVSHTDIYYAMHQEALAEGDSREPVKVLISRLRLKLDEAKLTSPSIRTVRGFGYVLDRRARQAD